MAALRIKKPYSLVLMACALLLASTGRSSGAIAFGAVTEGTSPVAAETPAPTETPTKAGYTISSVQWEQTPEDFVLRIHGDVTPTYTMYEMFDPLRVVLDIADAAFGEGVKLPLDLPHGPVSLVNGKILDDKTIARLEIFLNEDNGYKVEREANDLVVRFAKIETNQAASEEDAEPATAEETAVVPQAVNTPETGEPENVTSPAPESVAQATILKEIKTDYLPGETRIHLVADGTISNYKKADLIKNIKANRPDRMYVDLVGVKMAGSVRNLNIGTSVDRVRTARRPGGVRVVFDSSLDHLFSYQIEPTSNGLDVVITEPTEKGNAIAGIIQKQTETSPVSDEDVAASPTTAPEPATPVAEELPQTMDTQAMAQTAEAVAPDMGSVAAATPKEEPLTPAYVPPPVSAPTPEPVAKKSKKRTGRQEFAFAGYDKQRITVDFFKIDIHNVFRLFGEISHKNIVVDDGVSGTLTLRLNDVPWDFALDIILNLKGLQKEEQFNTIVISKKSKEFVWPERSADKIAIKENKKIVATEAISVKEGQKEPARITDAKVLYRRAQALERREEYASALPLYEQAFNKWQENSKLAHRIASLCLVHLGKNAKAVHYAKLAMRQNPADAEAALQAAIGLANMKKTADAKQYFDLAVSTPSPSGEALANYAAFLEDNNSLEAALSMLNRHEEIFGDTMKTMVSKARVLDKLGRREEARAEYRAVLLGGFNLPGDLKRYIKGRVTLSAN